MEGWRGREKDQAGDLEEKEGIEKSGDWNRKGWQQSFLDFPLSLTVWWTPIQEASGDWTPLIPAQINFLADRSVHFFFSFRQIIRKRGGWDFSISVLFRFYQSPKRHVKSRSLLFHDNNHLVTSHIKLNLCYMSLQINLCQPWFDGLLRLWVSWKCSKSLKHWFSDIILFVGFFFMGSLLSEDNIPTCLLSDLVFFSACFHPVDSWAEGQAWTPAVVCRKMHFYQPGNADNSVLCSHQW